MKTFHALTMPDALRAIKEELGPDAVILSTKQVRSGEGMFGMFGRTMIEVVAADDPPPAEARPSSVPRGPVAAALPRANAATPFQGALDRSLADAAVQAYAAGSEGPPAPARGEWGRLTRELHELRQLVEQSVEERRRAERLAGAPQLTGLPPRLAKWFYSLTNQDLEPEIAEKLVRQVHDILGRSGGDSEDAARRTLHRLLSSSIKVSGPMLTAAEQKKTVVFVGPTGVGKTTTIAKVAAHYQLKEKRRVAMITLDTYRVAAVEQLRLYANIIGVTLDVALTKREALDFIEKRRHNDLILLDTTGRSPMDPTGVEELHELLDLGHALETHLVMSATTRERDMMEAMSRYAALPIDYLLFTKLDETSAFGNVYTMMSRSGLPLSYFSTGQSVPEDLEVVRPERVADLLLGASPGRANTGVMTRTPGMAVRADTGSTMIDGARPSEPPMRPRTGPIAVPRKAERTSMETKPGAAIRPSVAKPGASSSASMAAGRRPAPPPRAGFASRLGAWLGFGQGGRM
jgi:flagellar biosynthesis protein FlhF